MSFARRLGQAFRREASLTSVRNVRHLDEQRIARLGASSDELNKRFGLRVSAVEKRVAALEAGVLGNEEVG